MRGAVFGLTLPRAMEPASIGFEEYVRMEQMSPTRHEWLEGLVRTVAPETPEHAAVVASVTGQLTAQLRGKACRVFGSSLRLRVVETGLSTYADAAIICGPMEFDPQDAGKTTVVNPRAVVEVLSTMSESHDREVKLRHYQLMPALQEIALVAHSSMRVDVWRRNASGWRCREYAQGGVAELQSIGCELVIAELYRD